MIKDLLKTKGIKTLTKGQQKDINAGNRGIGCQWSALSQTAASGLQYGTVDFNTVYQELYNECYYYQL